MGYLIIIWCIIGPLSFAYWWTRDHDLTVSELPLFLGSMVLGPMAFVAGYLIHGRRTRLIFIKKRK